jgi:predicted GTPase
MDVIGVISSVAASQPAAVHLSIGGAIASVGINMVMMLSFSVLTWWSMGDEEVFEAPVHAPESAEHFPLPTFLKDAGYERTINIGVFGMTGSGKSSLINAIRRKQPGDPEAAPVGVQETTVEPICYGLVEEQKVLYTPSGEHKDFSRPVRIWDLPGAGTTSFPSENYVRDMGLRYFDVVVLVVTGDSSQMESDVAEELDGFKVPHFIVRSQVDCDMENEMTDYGRTADEVERLIRKEMSLQGFSSVFLVSSRHSDKYDLNQLVSNIVASVQARRRVHKDEGCPICFEKFDDEHKCCRCHWCRNSVCSVCSVQLQGKLDETPCPFCRRWTSLSPHS